MQIHPQNWTDLLSQSHIVQYKLTVNSEVKSGDYVQGVPVIEKPMMLEPVIGRCCTGSLTVTVRDEENKNIPKAASVRLDCRLSSYDGSVVTDWIPQGRYWVSKRSGYGDLVALTCRDSMIFAGKTYVDKTSIRTWPAAMSDVLSDIASIIGVQIDPRTQINTGSEYTISVPDNDVLMSEVLAKIATVHGGNFIITESGKLRLVPFPAESAPVYDVKQAYKSYTPYSAGEVPVSRIILKNNGSSVQYTVGDDTGVWISGECDNATQAMTNRLGGGSYRFTNGTFIFPSGQLNNGTAVITDTALSFSTGTVKTLTDGLLGRKYTPYRLDGAYLDPCMELGDTFTAVYRGRTIQLIANSITVNCTTGYTCRVENGVMQDDEEEVVYVTPKEVAEQRTAARTLRNAAGIAAEKARAEAAESGLSSEISKLDNQIKLRVTKQDVDSSLENYLLIDDLKSEMGSVFQKGDETLAASFVTFINLQKDKSIAKIEADLIDLDGFVKASSINVDSQGQIKSYNIIAGDLSANKITLPGYQSDVEGGSSYGSSTDYTSHYLSMVKDSQSIGAQFLASADLNLTHAHAVTLDAQTGVLTLGNPVTVGDSSANFKIADSAWFKNQIVSARNGIDIKYQWGSPTVTDDSSQTNGKKYLLTFASAALGYYTQEEQETGPGSTETVSVWHQTRPASGSLSITAADVTSVYDAGFAAGQAKASAIIKANSIQYDNSASYASNKLMLDISAVPQLVLQNGKGESLSTTDQAGSTDTVQISAVPTAATLSRGSFANGKFTITGSGGKVRIGGSGSAGDDIPVSVTSLNLPISKYWYFGTYGQASQPSQATGSAYCEIDTDHGEATAAVLYRMALTGSITTPTFTWDETNHQYTYKLTGEVKADNVKILAPSGTATPITPTEAINYGKSQVNLYKTYNWNDSGTHAGTYTIKTSGRTNANGVTDEDVDYLTPTDAINYGTSLVTNGTPTWTGDTGVTINGTTGQNKHQYKLTTSGRKNSQGNADEDVGYLDPTDAINHGKTLVTVTAASIQESSVSYSSRPVTGTMNVTLNNGETATIQNVNLDDIYQSGLDGDGTYANEANFNFNLTDGSTSWLKPKGVNVSMIYQKGVEDASGTPVYYTHTTEQATFYRTLGDVIGSSATWGNLLANTEVKYLTTITKQQRMTIGNSSVTVTRTYYQVMYDGFTGYIRDTYCVSPYTPAIGDNGGWAGTVPVKAVDTVEIDVLQHVGYNDDVEIHLKPEGFPQSQYLSEYTSTPMAITDNNTGNYLNLIDGQYSKHSYNVYPGTITHQARLKVTYNTGDVEYVVIGFDSVATAPSIAYVNNVVKVVHNRSGDTYSYNGNFTIVIDEIGGYGEHNQGSTAVSNSDFISNYPTTSGVSASDCFNALKDNYYGKYDPSSTIGSYMKHRAILAVTYDDGTTGEVCVEFMSYEKETEVDYVTVMAIRHPTAEQSASDGYTGAMNLEMTPNYPNSSGGYPNSYVSYNGTYSDGNSYTLDDAAFTTYFARTYGVYIYTTTNPGTIEVEDGPNQTHTESKSILHTVYYVVHKTDGTNTYIRSRWGSIYH